MSAQLLQGRKSRYLISDQSLGQFFFNRATKYSERICQIDGTENKSETYGSVKLRSIRAAIELQKRKITPDDIITVCSTNTLDCLIPILAGLFAGVKVSNLDLTLSARHIKHLLNLVTPKIIFVEQVAVKLIENVLENLQFETEIVVFGESEKYTLFSDLTKFQKNEEEFVPVDVDPNDVALLFFSSGTTGFPKAVCHTHGSYLKIISQACHFGWGHGATLHFSTFYWMTAMMITFACNFFGTRRVFCRNPSAEDVFKIIETHKVYCTFMPPLMTYRLTRCKNAKNYDVSFLKIFSCGGNPIATSQIEKLCNLFPQTKFNLMYGITEIGIVAGFDSVLDQEFARIKNTSSGKVAPEVSLKIVDVNSREPLGPHQQGEICVSSPSVMKGYYKADCSDFDEHKFLKTGDIGYYDEDGFIYVIERIKEMFKCQGHHIVPSIIEEVLLEHPAIEEAVVFGVPSLEDDELPAACIVLKKGCVLEEGEILRYVADRVSNREKLRGGVIFVDAMPKTPSGKLARKQTKEFALRIKGIF